MHLPTLTFQRLRVLVAVYQAGSFNRAAEQLTMSQSAVSQHVKQLEASLGTRLFIRSARGVQPTQAGTTLHDYANRLLALALEAEHAVIQLDQVDGRRLAIGATPGLSVYVVPSWLQRFQDSYDKIDLSLQSLLTADCVGQVLDEKLDFGFVIGRLSDLVTPVLGQLELTTIPYRVVTSPAHPWATRGTVSLDMVAAAPFLTRQPSSRSRRWLDDLMHANGHSLTITAELDSPGSIKYAVLSNMGVSILPTYSIERELEKGELATVTIENVRFERPLQLLWNRQATLSTTQRAFLKMLAIDYRSLIELLT